MSLETSLPENAEEINTFVEENQKKYKLNFGYWDPKNKFPYNPKEVEVILKDGDFASLYKEVFINNKGANEKNKRGTYFSPLTYLGERRITQECTSVQWLVYDIDGKKGEKAGETTGIPEHIYQRIVNSADFGFQFACDETFNSTIDKRKLRIVIPLEEPLAVKGNDFYKNYKDTYDYVWKNMIVASDGDEPCFELLQYDESCHDLTRLYFLHRNIKNDGEAAEYFTGSDIWGLLDFKKAFDFVAKINKEKDDDEKKSKGGLYIVPRTETDCIPLRGFELRDKNLIAKIEDLIKNAVVGSRNSTLNSWVWKELGYYREAYTEAEFKEICNFIINRFAEKNHVMMISGKSEDQSKADYLSEVKRTFYSAMNSSSMNFDYNGKPFEEYRKFSPLLKDVYNFFHKDPRWKDRLLLGKERDSEIMEMLGKEVFSNHILVFKDCFYVYNIKNKMWETPDKDIMEDGGQTSMASDEIGQDNSIDIISQIKTEIRPAITWRYNLINSRYLSEFEFLRSKCLKNGMKKEDEIQKAIKEDAQLQTVLKLLTPNKIHAMRLADNSTSNKNMEEALKKVFRKYESKFFPSWCDKIVPKVVETDKIRIPMKWKTAYGWNCQILVYDEQSKTFVSSEPKKSDYVRFDYCIETNGQYIHGGDYENVVWDRYIDGIFDDKESNDGLVTNKKYLQRILGSGLVVDVVDELRGMVLLYGPHSNGKSKLYEIMKGVFGKGFVGAMKINVFYDSAEADKANSLVATMNDSRLVFIDEFQTPPGVSLGGTFKSTVTGGDIQCRIQHSGTQKIIRKRGLFFGALNYGCFPTTSGSSKDAVWERVTFLDTPFIFFDNEDNHKFDKNNRFHRIANASLITLMLQQDKNAIIQWFLNGALEIINETKAHNEIIFLKENEGKNITSPIRIKTRDSMRVKREVEGLLYKGVNDVIDHFLVESVGDVVVLKDLTDAIFEDPTFRRTFKADNYHVERLQEAGYIIKKVESSRRNDPNGKKSSRNCIIGYKWKGLGDDIRYFASL